MRIVLEGPNGSGKSTLAEALAKYLGWSLHHAGTSDYNHQVSISNCLLQLKMQNTVLDRVTYISERVYQADGNEGSEFFNTMESITKAYAQSTVYIYCVGKGPVTKKPYYTDAHYRQVREDRQKIKKRYDEVFSSIDHIKYNFNVLDYDVLFEWVVTELRNRGYTI